MQKCFIEHYRFSKDLDFSALNPEFKLDEKLLKQIVDIERSRTVMSLFIDKLTELKHKDKSMGYTAIIKLWGAEHARDQAPPLPKRWTTARKIEIIKYEKMIFQIVSMSVFHDYSDHLSSAVDGVPCNDI